MSTATQYPKTNIVKLNPPATSSATRDNTATDGVSFFYFIKILINISHQLMSIMFFFFA
jgi:hypothetical protein